MSRQPVLRCLGPGEPIRYHYLTTIWPLFEHSRSSRYMSIELALAIVTVTQLLPSIPSLSSRYVSIELPVTWSRIQSRTWSLRRLPVTWSRIQSRTWSLRRLPLRDWLCEISCLRLCKTILHLACIPAFLAEPGINAGYLWRVALCGLLPGRVYL
jgi:hypothetical protein